MQLEWKQGAALSWGKCFLRKSKAHPPSEKRDIALYWENAGSGLTDSDTLLLRLLNDPASTFDFLDITVGLNRRAAEQIVRYRDGPDGLRGTTDDNLYDTVEELDQVKYVGTSTLNLLRDYAVEHAN